MSEAVVHVVVAGEVGGAERMLVDLAQRASRPHSIALITPSDRLRSLFEASGIPVDDRGPRSEGPIRYLRSTFGRSDAAWLVSVLRKRDARIVHLHTFASQVLGTRAARSVGARIVRTEHSTRVYEDPSCWPFSRWSLVRADAAVAISQHVRDVALARAPWAASKMVVVPNGVDVNRFEPIGLADGSRPVRFVAVGRLEPRKGLDLAIEALARTPHAELRIVGDGELRDALEARARRLGVARRVTFTGYQTDVRGAIRDAHAILSSARREGLGIALLEAMAMGRPAVALPAGGIPEFVDQDTGWLARDMSVGALVDAMSEAVAAGPAEMTRRGARAREVVCARFSLDAMRRSYEGIYPRVLELSAGDR